jgi:FlaA1/EpsC-like NDP-sugar epimerase
MQSNEYKPIFFIDDSLEIQGHSINGMKVMAPSELEKLIDKKNVSEVLLAIPNISRTRRKEIIDFLEPYPILVRSLPSILSLAQGKVQISDLREINIVDLLGRESVLANNKLLSINIQDKVVLVTGAGGSIGSELCRQIVYLKPKKLLLIDSNEFALYSIDDELSRLDSSNVQILSFLGSVINSNRLSYIIKKFGVQTIYHAAAYKHVPIVEFNSIEGVSNNIFGTFNCNLRAI